MQRLAAVGIDMTAVGRTLEDNGIASFDKAYQDILRTLAATTRPDARTERSQDASRPAPEPLVDRSDPPPRRETPASLSLSSAVMFVTTWSDRPRSMRNCWLEHRGPRFDAALLPALIGFQLYLRGRGHVRCAAAATSVCSTSCGLRRRDDLDRCERVLRNQSDHVVRSARDGSP